MPSTYVCTDTSSSRPPTTVPSSTKSSPNSPSSSIWSNATRSPRPTPLSLPLSSSTASMPSVHPSQISLVGVSLPTSLSKPSKRPRPMLASSALHLLQFPRILRPSPRSRLCSLVFCFQICFHYVAPTFKLPCMSLSFSLYFFVLLYLPFLKIDFKNLRILPSTYMSRLIYLFRVVALAHSLTYLFVSQASSREMPQQAVARDDLDNPVHTNWKGRLVSSGVAGSAK
ncbi:hypothetical protein M413DRAFT_384738 [Hebeloma cylindrosporum]|uniref:Uncharacterized protein n=1 Tax=Hebeloma cylindrosporum TaxID=76867 RepID=A0A0C2Y1B4_HEBCY|nr:hypothetical protein M413DRAFT_384738 [Hebeloma cylindrosporum h7]